MFQIPHKEKWCLAGLLAVVVVGGLIRVWPIASCPLWFDEAWTWYVAAEGQYLDMLRWDLLDVHAPLSFVAAKASMDLFGTQSAWALRLPALVAGMLCIPAGYGLGRVVHGPGLGLLVAALVAFDPSMVDQSQQARMFSMLALFTLVSMAWAIVLVRDPSRSGWQWAGLGVVLGLALNANHFAVTVWAGIGLAGVGLIVGGWFIGQRYPEPKKLIMGFMVAYGVAVVVAGYGIVDIVGRALTPKELGGDPPSWLAVSRAIVVALSDTIHLTPVGLVVCPLAAVGLWALSRRCKTATAVLVAVGVMSVLILFPFRQQVRWIYPRYLVALQPTLWVGLGMFAIGLRSKPCRVGALALVVGYCGVQAWQSMSLSQWYHQPDRYLVSPEVVYVRERAKTGDAVVYHPRVLDVFGKYHKLPADQAAQDGLYHGNQLRDAPRLLDGWRASATWVIIGMINYEGRFKEVQAILGAVAGHYGVQIDAQALSQHLGLERVIVARVSRGGILWRSVGVGGGVIESSPHRSDLP